VPSTPTYWDYLKLDRLLDLQTGFEADEDDLRPDELHFIIVHQVYELWFKLVIRSLRLARDRLAAPSVAEETIPFVTHHLRRVTAILGLAVDQFDVMETLTPQDFLAFRDKLVPSSGFQSFQMREIEILMGLSESERLQYGRVDPIEHIEALGQGTPAGRLAAERVRQARGESTMLEALNAWLYRTPIHGSPPGEPGDAAAVREFLDAYLEALDGSRHRQLEQLVAGLGERTRPELTTRFDGMLDVARSFLYAEGVEGDAATVRRCRAAALFIESYRDLPLLAWPRLLLDAIVAMEERFVLWRHRHARMVERLIGRRVGTGGSGGVDYLDQTSAYRVFKDLWAIRTLLLPKGELPALRDPEFYAFAHE